MGRRIACITRAQSKRVKHTPRKEQISILPGAMSCPILPNIIADFGDVGKDFPFRCSDKFTESAATLRSILDTSLVREEERFAQCHLEEGVSKYKCPLENLIV